jgi:hypothetical protein
MGIEEINKAWRKIDMDALVEGVTTQFKLPGWSPCSWVEDPGCFLVSQGRISLFAWMPEHDLKIIHVDLVQDWYEVTGWAIPYKGKLTAPKMIKAIKDCINVYMTEEIEGVDYS